MHMRVFVLRRIVCIVVYARVRAWVFWRSLGKWLEVCRGGPPAGRTLSTEEGSGRRRCSTTAPSKKTVSLLALMSLVSEIQL